jgi:hypothetical protein
MQVQQIPDRTTEHTMGCTPFPATSLLCIQLLCRCSTSVPHQPRGCTAVHPCTDVICAALMVLVPHNLSSVDTYCAGAADHADRTRHHGCNFPGPQLSSVWHRPIRPPNALPAHAKAESQQATLKRLPHEHQSSYLLHVYGRAYGAVGGRQRACGRRGWSQGLSEGMASDDEDGQV